MVKSCHELTIFEASREFSFCAHALLEAKGFVIEDTHQSDIFLTILLSLPAPQLDFTQANLFRLMVNVLGHSV